MIAGYGNCLPLSRNRARSVGTTMPNAFGLFDMHGNVAEWCVNRYDAIPSQRQWAEKSAQPVMVTDNELRQLRGGGFSDMALSTRASRINPQPAAVHLATVGLRLARTMPVQQNSVH